MTRTESPTAFASHLPHTRTAWPFRILVVYLFLEYGRLQDMVPGLGALSLPLVATLALAVLLACSGRSLFRDRQTKLFIALLALMAVHVPLATNNYYAFHTWRAMVQTFVAYLAVVHFIEDYAALRQLVGAWLLIHAFVSIGGILSGGRGPGGWLGDENDLSLVLNMAVPFSVFLFLSSSRASRRAYMAALTVLFVSAIMLSFSRGGFLGLLAVALHSWLRSPRKVIATVLAPLCLLAAIQLAPDGYWDEMYTIQQEVSGEIEGTGAGRQYEWKIGWRMFLANPVLGVGQGNFSMRFAEYEGFDQFEERSLAGRASHSVYYTLIPELGLVGILLFGAMLYGMWADLLHVRRSLRQSSPPASRPHMKEPLAIGYALEGSSIAFVVSGTFLSALYYPLFWILMAFILAYRKVTSPDAA